MKNIIVISTALVVGLFFLAPQFSYGSDDPLTLGIFPRRNSKITHKLFKPMADHLSRELARPVILETSKDFEEFWTKLTARKYDMVHLNQYHYVVAHQEFGYQVVGVNSEFGRPTISGSIIVRKDSGIDSIMDLKGKKIVFGGGPRAMQSYIFATYLLRQGGLQAGDYIEEYALNPPNAIKAAYFKQADAAGSGDAVLFLDVVRKEIDIEQLKHLVRGQQLPHLTWAVKNSLAPELIDRIKTILYSLKESADGRAVLEAARLDDLVEADDQDFDQHRVIIKEVTGEQY